MRTTRGLRGILATACIACAGCTLAEVTLAPPEKLVVAEMVLQAGASQQFALLHRTLGSGQLTAPGATIELTVPGGGVVAYAATAVQNCVDSSTTFLPDTVGSCYATPVASTSLVVPGGTYSVRIRLPDGGQLTGTTTVPGAFRLTRPNSLAHCSLPAGTLLPLEWTQSQGAWVYLSESRLTHVRRALDPNATSDKSLDMVGLSISAEDTTIMYPSELGVFDRFDESDAAVLVALQRGLPAGVTATVTVAAADRNYVQWVRGGNFNPSGAIQIPSLEGEGTGVLGSLVPLRFDLTSSSSSTLPACGS